MGFFLLLLPSSLLSQSVYYQNYAEADGLSHTACFDLFQDSKGFIWVGTNTGLDRFDGTGFKTMTEADGFSGTLLRKIDEDDRGRIWVFTYFDGVFISNSESPKLTFEEHPANDSIKQLEPGLHDFTIGQGDSLALAATGRLIAMNAMGEKRKIAYNTPGILTHDANHQRAFGFIYDSINEVQKVSGKDTQRFDIPAIHQLSGRPIYLDSATLVYGTYVFQFHDSSCSIDTLPEAANCIEKISDNTYLIGSSSGLWMHNVASKKSHLLLANIIVSDLLFDRQSNLWASTRKNGIFKFPSFQVLSYPLTEGLDKKMLGFATDDSPHGVCAFSSQHVFEKPEHERTFKEIFQLTEPANLLSDVLVPASGTEKYLICPYGYPNLWAIKNGEGIKQVRYPLSRQVHHGRLRDGKLYLTGRTGAFTYDFETDVSAQLPPDSVVILCFSLDQDAAGSFWFGGKGGLFRETEVGLKHEVELDELIIDIDFYEGHVVIGSQKGGLYLWDTVRQEMLNLREADGLISNKVRRVTVHDDRIYACTSKGVSSIFHSENGWVIEDPYINSVLGFPAVKDLTFRDGLAWLCLDHSVVSFPINLSRPQHSSPVEITDVIADGRSIIGESTQYDFDNNELTIAFKAPHFVNERNEAYRYRLLGSANERWTEIDAGQLSLAALEPGDYEFQVKPAWQNEGNELAASVFAFKIKPPFWGTWWFRSLGALMVVLISLVVIRIRGLRIENREALKTELVRLELKALKAQINPHFIYNAISSVQYYLRQNQPAEAEQYMRDFANLIRKVLEHSDKSLVSLESELHLIRNYVNLESRKFEGHGILLETKLGDNINPENVKLPPALFQPYVENAIWHGLKNKVGNRSLRVSIQKERKKLVVIVTDNGIGRMAAAKQIIDKHRRRSFGIAIASERIQALNGPTAKNTVMIEDLTDKSGNPAGTKVTLMVPYIEFAE